ncbi:NAD(P)-binding protein [Aspergillus cavernicola]|uniref:NAD(P)-binding protein n=1 Tax=Aspergillus cavernicola TaxID=176166 RepID=A0ABR4IBG9_9EURO
MPSYVITGASRGIGFEFLRQLSADNANLVVGLVRDKPTTEAKVAKELPGRNIHIIEGDITDYDGLKKAVAEVAKLTDGVDYLIANAAVVSPWSAYDGIGDLAQSPKELEKDLVESFKVNVVGNIHLFSLFLPLVMKGNAKKVITITSGMADIEFISTYDIAPAAPYSISKAGMNAAVAKFSAQYKKDGILFIGISPGMVDTGHYGNATEEQLAEAVKMVQKFSTYAPFFNGPITPEESVSAILDVITHADIKKGHAGAFVSHYGNKQWL